MKKFLFLAFFTNMLLTNVLFADTITLTSGVPESSHVNKGADKQYKIEMTAGQSLNTVLNGLNADADLYVRVGAKPTASLYDCRSTKGETLSETCSVSVEENVAVYVTVYGYRAANYVLIATLNGGENDDENGGGNDNINVSNSVTQGETKFYTIAALTGQTVHTVLNGLSADADLYVRVGAKPTGSLYDCRPYKGGINSETCSVTVSENTTVHISVNGFRAANYTLTATINNGGGIIPTLTSGETVSGSVDEGIIKYYKISGQLAEKVTATISELSADADIYIKKSSKPTTASFDCKSTHGGTNSDSCTLDLTSDAEVYIGVFGFRTADYNLLVTSQRELIPANPEVPTVLEDAEGGTLNPDWITRRGNKPGYIFPTPDIPGAPAGTGVMVHHANGSGASLYRYELPINNTSQRVLSMDMGGLPNHKFDDYPESRRGYIPHSSVGVIVETRLGTRFMEWDSWYTHQGYGPRKDDSGYNTFLMFPSPVEMVRGWYKPTTLWTHFEVNLDDELHRIEPNNDIIRVKQFYTTGGYLDNITLSQAE